MRIDIEFTTQVRALTGQTHEVVEVADGSSLRELLHHLLQRIPELTRWVDEVGRPRPGLLVFVNARSVEDDALLKSGDHVELLTMVSGG